MKKTFVVVLIAVGASRVSFAQPLSKQQCWQLLDYRQDTVYGASVNRAYKELLQGKKSHPAIVAVIDEGIDVGHEDLKGHIWTNTKEIPGNGIDDDHDGYVDDVHGWNFLGGKDGRNIYATSSEADREYARLLPNAATFDSAQRVYFARVKKEHIEDSVARNRDQYSLLKARVTPLAIQDSIAKKALGLNDLHYSDVISWHPTDSGLVTTQNSLLAFYKQANARGKAMALDSFLQLANQRLLVLKKDQELYALVKSDPWAQRRDIVGDNPTDILDTHYGNNIVGDEYADHGTHCAGIIAATRGNGIGLDGVADNVLILPVRAVNALHYGDEQDKDIALAIRYAVDHGARIISMSFGKDFSPNKPWVDAAVQYAAGKGVLLIHAAGNDHANIDSTDNYPSADYKDGSGRAWNLINVGAISSDTGYVLTAPYSNYGQRNVDLFAPGSEIYSSLPGNQYEYFSGTSMATPLVAGVAALLLEYYPDLTAKQLKNILLESVTSLKGKMVYKPGTKQLVDFGTMCSTGGVVNAYNALQLAAKTTGH